MAVTFGLVTLLHLALPILVYATKDKAPDCPPKVIDALTSSLCGPSWPNGPGRPKFSIEKTFSTSSSGRKAKDCDQPSDCSSTEGCAKLRCSIEEVTISSGQCADCSKKSQYESAGVPGLTFVGCGSGTLQVFHVVVLLAFVAMCRFPVVLQS